jgi:phage shock protein PspC (stress-responsive transcriptional regulator)
LRRSATDKMLGGVCGGLAEYSGIDPLLWRVGFVALSFAGGSGILVYLVLWLLMPTASADPASPSYERSGRRVRQDPGPRSPVPRMTIAALLIVVGALALLTRLPGWNLGPSVFFGSALLVVGLGLVAAAFSRGRRARGGLILLGVVLAIGSAGASTTIPWHDIHSGSMGDRTYRPTTAAQVQPSYEGGVGDMTLDLRGVDVSSLSGPITTRVGHGVGDVTIEVPADADVHLTVHNGLGSVDAFGHGAVDDGFFPGTGTGSWVNDGTAEFDLMINAGLGDVKVSRG